MNIVNTTYCLARNNDKNVIETLNDYKECGYSFLDISFTGIHIKGGTFILNDDWKENAYQIKNKAEKLGIKFAQCHPPFTSTNPELNDNEEFYYKMLERSLKAAAILEVPIAVFHPIDAKEYDEFNNELSEKMTHDVYDKYVDLAIKHDIKIAYENLPMYDFYPRRYASIAEDLVSLVDSYKDDRVGVCWDTGHGNITYKHGHANALKKIDKRLIALHIQDNKGKGDDHIFPFEGTINWNKILRALKEIEYSGNFTFESTSPYEKIPYELRLELLKYNYKLGKHMIDIMNSY